MKLQKHKTVREKSIMKTEPVINDDDIVVAFCNLNVAHELKLPGDVAVITDLLTDDQVVVVKRDEFLDWLFEMDE